MNDEKPTPPTSPTPLQDVRKGLGLLFRAARTAVERLPKGGVEEVVMTSAREVGRAIENVASALEREVFGKKSAPPTPPQEDSAHPRKSASAEGEAKTGEPKPPDSSV